MREVRLRPTIRPSRSTGRWRRTRQARRRRCGGKRSRTKNYDDLNYRDDQFDLSDAALAIAIALLAVTALTQLWALYWATLVPTVFGIVMGTAGLAGWQLHPGLLVKLLS